MKVMSWSEVQLKVQIQLIYSNQQEIRHFGYVNEMVM